MIESLPDRSAQLFGRAAHIRQLLDRVSEPGLTAVVARPLMGKTWTLTEVARQWYEQGDLVGYHESKGAESSHLLYAVSNLYARWLSDSSMREQAMSLWAQHKGTLVPRVGQMVGSLFEKIGGAVGLDNVSGLVRQAFDGLAEAQKDLQNGGLQLAPLPYDQALSLTKLVADVTGRRIVLILDAWEKSAVVRAEHATLEAFLKHLDDWPNAHVVLAIRHPELGTTKDDEAYQCAKNLRDISAAAQIFVLGEMDLSSATERQRLMASVRQIVPAAKSVSDEQLFDMIDSYPGVVSFWTSKANRSAMATTEDLGMVAQNAQGGRYAELDRLLRSLPDARCALAARLAFMPRLDETRWKALQELVLDGVAMTDVNALVDAAVLSEERVPTFGHDTRQAAARKWFIENRVQMIRRLGANLVRTMAERITGVNNESRVYFEELIGCAVSASDVGIYSDVGFLISAARCAFEDVDEALRPEFDAQYPSEIRRTPVLVPVIAQALTYRGVAKWCSGNRNGSIADFTAVIGMPGVPVEQVALALYNRGVAKGKDDDYEGAIADYSEVIELHGAPTEQMAKALVTRGVARGGNGDRAGAIADYSAVIELPGAPAEQVAKALDNRGVAREKEGDREGAIADFTKVVVFPGALAEHVAQARNNRGIARGQKGDREGAIIDFTAVIELPGTPVEQVATAFYNRGIANEMKGDIEGSIADFSAVFGLPGAPAELVGQALNKRGVVKGLNGDRGGAIADFTLAVQLPGVPADQVANALNNRGAAKGYEGDREGAITDFNAAVELPGAPAEQVANALNNRGAAKGHGGDREGAIADYTAVVELPGAPAEQVAKALNNRGVAKVQKGERESAVADFIAVIELPGAPSRQLAWALFNRGLSKGTVGNMDGAIDDYTTVIELPGASAEQVAQARYNRGAAKAQKGDRDGVIADLTAILKLPGAPRDVVDAVRQNLKHMGVT